MHALNFRVGTSLVRVAPLLAVVTSPVLNSIYDYNFAQAPTTTTNVNAAVVNAFFLVNTVHDFTYRYGFTEATFNFQTNNFWKGWSRQRSRHRERAGPDNADFLTPPIWTHGDVPVGFHQSKSTASDLWLSLAPARDGAVEDDIVIHENTHRVTNRMTGGGTARCLQTTESGGMGEGWSDSMADWASQGPTTVDFVLGTFVINNPAGLRSHPYSTSATTNPLRYSSLKTLTEVHAIGEIWANMLHNVNPDGPDGNIVFLHLFLDVLLLQPCNPTFLTARDAWIQADANRYAGANSLLWNVFASRGLGVNAANHNDDSTVPAGC
ncbi:peptidase M36 [Lactarius hatsudake]|nr:peptidase M36 [Lactarius hatsudake]